MEEINFKEIQSYILSKFYVVLLIFATIFIGGEIYAHYLQTPLYESSTKLVLLNENNTNQLTTNDVTLSNSLVNTYSEIVKSRNVLSQVTENLNLDYDTSTLAGKITVSTTTGTQLITVKVTDSDPAQAQIIANEIAKVFKKEIANIYNFDNVQIVDKASIPSSPYNVNIIRQTAIYAALGLALGLGVTLAMYLLDNSIKDSQTVEDRLGLTVIGIVPNMGKK